MPVILVTGGAGYIGSHTVLALLESGYEVVVVDNFINASVESLHRVSEMVGKPVKVYNADLRDGATLDTVFRNHKVSAVIHFAGLKAVGESVSKPLEYFDNNVGGTIVLLQAMKRAGVRNLVFSSSATVYGDPTSVPVAEDAPLRATNPYGRTKLFIEEILRDVDRSEPGQWSITILRYFNPVGAHPSGRIGEDPKGIPANLMPFVSQVAAGKREGVIIFGNDYPTPDGTGVRDYIHVVDLALGHISALAHLHDGIEVFNLGTGKGSSVLEVIRAFEKASDRPIPYTVSARRPGDVASVYSDPSRANTVLCWFATRTLEDMCRDAWNWQSQNPEGFI